MDRKGGDRNEWKLPAAVLGTGFAMAVLAGVLSPAGGGGNAGSGKPKAKTEESAAYDITALTDPTEETEAKLLTEAQTMIMEKLLTRMEAGDLAGAASCMETYKAETASLLKDSFGGERYLYHKNGIAESIDGRGIVLTSPSTLFYGNFRNGVPQGQGTALQGIVLEEPRYDYSTGVWSNGKMNGYGTSGYIYYEGAGDKDGLKTEKCGIFKDDLMEGEIRYTSINNSGNSFTWILTANAGVTQIDDRWSYKKASKEYYLLSENDESHAYVLKESDREAVNWKNRIVWRD